MTASELIRHLEALRSDFGDREVILAKDPEGNAYGTLDAKYSLGIDDDNNVIVLFPCEQFTDFKA